MKKRKIAAALAICLTLCCILPTAAFAAEEQTSATTTVLYTVQGGYTVHIPASVNLNNNETIEIKASNMTLAAGKDLVVRINSNSFDENGDFYLRASGAGSILCNIICAGEEEAGSHYVWHEEAKNNAVVARFSSIAQFSGGYYKPTLYGYISFLISDPGLVAGDFTGTLNFIIGFENHVAN